MRSFHPPERVLLGPGPSEVSARVRLAAARPTIGHLDPAFQALMQDVRTALVRLFHASDYDCLPLPGPGTTAMEAAFLNLLEPGEVAVVAVNGVFGGRMAEMAERAGAEVVRVEDPWGRPVDPEKVEAALWARGAKVLGFVHAETSTGALSDPGPLCALAREHGALSIVDAVTSLGGLPVAAATWGADVVYSGSQKCLSAPPGLAPLAVSPRAMAAVRARTSRPRTWVSDLQLLLSYWGEPSNARAYHHTAPVNAVYGLHEALVAFFEEGEGAVFARHRRAHAHLAAALKVMGLEFFVAEEHRLPQLNAVAVPEGIDEAQVRARLLDLYGVEIGSGLGALRGKIWRIGFMGEGASPSKVRLLVAGLGEALSVQGWSVSVGEALSAAALSD